MKQLAALLFILLFLPDVQSQSQKIITSDIDNFWKAYDQIVLSTDSAQQYHYLDSLYLRKASEGLRALMDVRRYTAKGYIDAINNYAEFWRSIRSNTFKSKKISGEIEANIAQLQKLYPALQPSAIYFSVGLFRSNGTIDGHKVLIGSEMALSDKTVDVSKLSDHVKEFNALYTPINDIGLLCTHEYVHTQQKPPVDNLLSYCIYEGVAEFVSTLAAAKPSYLNAIVFGKQNYPKIRDQFEQDLFVPSRTYNWLWSNRKIFNYRDLGYSVGFEMAERYYKQAKDKTQAIKTMIELDFENETHVEKFVDQTGYLSKPLHELYDAFQGSRPQVKTILEFQNGDTQVSPDIARITLEFSEPMDPETRGFDYGPLGEPNVLRVQRVIGFSEDKKRFTFEVKLEPGKHYQCLVTNHFANTAGIPLKPYLIDIATR